MCVGDMSRRLHHDRVTVRRALRNDVGPDGACRAAPVIDHELLARDLGDFLEDQPTDHVV